MRACSRREKDCRRARLEARERSREVAVGTARGTWPGWNKLEKLQQQDLLRLGVGSGNRICFFWAAVDGKWAPE